MPYPNFIRRLAAAAFLFTLANAALHCKKDIPVSNSHVIGAQTFEMAKKRTVSIFNDTGTIPIGSGILVNGRGRILTCFHVIVGKEKIIAVKYQDKLHTKLTVIKKSFDHDLALIQSDINSEVQDITWIDEDDLTLNQEVYAVGNAYGLENTFLRGYISALDRDSRTYEEIGFIQTQGISYPGVSGAGVFLQDGRYIGINQATFGDMAGNGFGMTIPSSTIKDFLD